MKVPQADITWRKSTRSGDTACVELGSACRGVRDSKNPAGPVLMLPTTSLLAAVKTDRIAR